MEREKRWTTLLIIREIQIKTIMRYHLLGCVKFNFLKIILRANKNAEQLKRSRSAGGDASWTIAWQFNQTAQHSHFQVFTQVKQRLLFTEFYHGPKMYADVYNVPKQETTQKCFNWEQISNGLRLNSKKAQSKWIRAKHDEPEMHYAK